MDFRLLIGVVLFVFFIFKTRIVASLIDVIRSTRWYKKKFAEFIKTFSEMASTKGSPMYELKSSFYAEIDKKLQDLPGDVLEIGAGAGHSYYFLPRLPQGCSLVIVDYNPCFESIFRKQMATKYPDIKLKNYFVQSAADMSNIPDNSFSVVMVHDVLCSIKEDDLRKALQEVKRVLKADGCFYFLEHILDKPNTLRRLSQKLLCWFYIWPGLFDGCHCNAEADRLIEEAGFKSVSLSYSYIPWPSTAVGLFNKFVLYNIQYFVSGYAEK